MSDRAKSSVVSNQAKSQKPQSRVLGKLKTIVHLCGEIEKEEGGLKSYEDLQDEVRRLHGQVEATNKALVAKTTAVKERDEIIAGLHNEAATVASQYQHEKEILMNNFAEQASRWQKDMTLKQQYENNVQDLSQKLQHAASEVQHLKRQLNQFKTKHQTSAEELQTTKSENANLKETIKTKDLSLQLAERKRERAEQQQKSLLADIGINELDPKLLAEAFIEFASNCHTLIKRFFIGSTTNENLVDAIRSFRDQDSGIVPGSFLSLIGAEQPRYILMAIAEAVLSHTLCSHIFRPYYVLDNSETDSLLNALEQTSPYRAALLRCQLASVFDVHDKDIKGLARGAADKVVGLLFTNQDTRPAEFHQELVNLFCQGVEMWRRVQGSEIRPTATDFRDNPEDWEESTDKLTDYDDLVSLTQEEELLRPLVDPIITLFPRISLGPHIIHRGFALWRDQNVVVAATVSYMGYGKRKLDTPRRRMSNGKSRPLSFSEHAQARKSLPDSPRT